MFKPNYKVTDKILNNLTEIAVARDIVEKARLVPKWEIYLRQEALMHAAHSSTHIEGNRLSLDEVSQLALGREVSATRKDKQEVLIKQLSKKFGTTTQDEKIIKSISDKVKLDSALDEILFAESKDVVLRALGVKEG